MDIWIPLIAAVMGGFLAVIPVMITLRNQSREREKDREEARKEAKIQNRVKWLEKDILRLMEAIQIVLDELSYANRLLRETDTWPLKNIEIPDDADTVPPRMEDFNQRVVETSTKLFRAMAEIDSLANSFDEIQSEYRLFIVTIYEYRRKFVAKKPNETENQTVNWRTVCDSAGKFHKALREQLISLRE
jgi:hypothetical protein